MENKKHNYDSNIRVKANDPLAQRLCMLVDSSKVRDDLAEYIGKSPRAVNQFKLGTNKPRFDTLKKIAEYFDCSLDFLVGLTDCPARADRFMITEEDYSKRLNQFLAMTGLTTGAFLAFSTIYARDTLAANGDILNLLIENPGLSMFLLMVEHAIICENKEYKDPGNELGTEYYLFRAIGALREMIPHLAAEFKRRGYLTTEERIEMRKGGTDDGKL